MDTLDALLPGILANTGSGTSSTNSLDNMVAEAIAGRNNPTYATMEPLNPTVGFNPAPSGSPAPDSIPLGQEDIVNSPDDIDNRIVNPEAFLGKGLQTSLLKNTPSEPLVGSPTMGLETLSKSLATSGQQITIHEHIDLRGAYGISSPAIAEKVYRDVWAPARRKVVNNYVNSRGKVMR